MKNSISLLLLAFLFLTGASYSQEWDTYESGDYNFSISIPSDWKTSTGEEDGIPYLESISPDETLSLFIFVYKDETIGLQQLMDNAISDMGVGIVGEASPHNLNGLNALVAKAFGNINGVEIDMLVVTATFNENNYVAYTFTASDNYDKNSATMTKIINSLSVIF